MDRRHFMLAALSVPLLAQPALAMTTGMEVYKSPTCGCCSAWVEHMIGAGFVVETKDVDQEILWDLKTRSGVVPDLSSCHTAFVEGYVVEGHVPAGDVRRLLAERPDALGLTVPGMPIGSPGMEMGDWRDPFNTLLVLRNGKTVVFEQHL